jgi:hypothetical protein
MGDRDNDNELSKSATRLPEIDGKPRLDSVDIDIMLSDLGVEKPQPKQPPVIDIDEALTDIKQYVNREDSISYTNSGPFPVQVSKSQADPKQDREEDDDDEDDDDQHPRFPAPRNRQRGDDFKQQVQKPKRQFSKMLKDFAYDEQMKQPQQSYNISVQQLPDLKPIVVQIGQIEGPASNFIVQYDEKQDILELMPPENPKLSHAEGFQTSNMQVERERSLLLKEAKEDINARADKYVLIHTFPFQGHMQFTCKFILESLCARNFVRSYAFLTILIIFSLCYAIVVEWLKLAETYSWFVTVPFWFIGFILSVLLLSHIEKHLLKNLILRFDFWFLMLHICVISVSSLFQTNSTMPQNFLKATTTLVTHTMVVLFDAIPNLKLRIKLWALVFLIGTGIWNFVKARYSPDSYSLCSFYCIDVLRYRLSSYTTVFIFYLKFLHNLVRKPKNKIMINSPMNYHRERPLQVRKPQDKPSGKQNISQMVKKYSSKFLALERMDSSGCAVDIPPRVTELSPNPAEESSKETKVPEPKPLDSITEETITTVETDVKLARPMARSIPFVDVVRGDNRSYAMKPALALESTRFRPFWKNNLVHAIVMSRRTGYFAIVCGLSMLILIVLGKTSYPQAVIPAIPLWILHLCYMSQMDRRLFRMLISEFDFKFLMYNLICATVFGMLDNLNSGDPDLNGMWRQINGYSIFVVAHIQAICADAILRFPRQLRAVLWLMLTLDHIRSLVNAIIIRQGVSNGTYCLFYCADPLKLSSSASLTLMLFCLKSTVSMARFPKRFSMIKSPMTSVLIVDTKQANAEGQTPTIRNSQVTRK